MDRTGRRSQSLCLNSLLTRLELKQRFTSTTGLDEEEFGFSSQT